MTPPLSDIQPTSSPAQPSSTETTAAVAVPGAEGQPEVLEQVAMGKKQAKQASKTDKKEAKETSAKLKPGSRLQVIRPIEAIQAIQAKFSKSTKGKAFRSPGANRSEHQALATPAPISSSGFSRPDSASKATVSSPQAKPKKTAAPAPSAAPATSLNAHELVLGWFKAYPGLWLSPLVLGLLGGWVIAQPEPSPSLTSAETETLAPVTPLPPFVHREAAPLGPVSPGGEAGTVEADGQLLADPPSAEALSPASSTPEAAAETPSETPVADLISSYAAQSSSAAASSSGASADIAAALPGVPPAGASATEQANPAAIATQIEAQVSAASQSQAAADTVPANAKFALEERAKAQAAAFAQAKANQAASNTPPQPAPPVQGNPAVDQLITMQVAIAEGDTTLSMGGSNQSVIMTQAGEPLLQLEAGDYAMQCDGSGLLLNGEKLPPTVMMAPYGGGLNYVRDRSYRGQIQFICQGTTVLAVNHIDMLQYLYSVVGSEVSASWPTAALKAQSVAARSYALTYYFRPAKEHFHIGDTESYQVYKGTVSEDERVKAAVQATAGEFISYQGGIVESLYAASDDIVMEAFQGGGMSQLGALDFAEQGYNYLQILGYYYPQTSLGRMVIEDGA